MSSAVSPRPPDVSEKGRGFFWCEAQFVGIQFGELSTSAQTCYRQGRLCPAGDDQMYRCREVIQQKDDAIVGVWIIDQVIVVKDQDERRQGNQLIDEAAQRCLNQQHASTGVELCGNGG